MDVGELIFNLYCFQRYKSFLIVRKEYCTEEVVLIFDYSNDLVKKFLFYS